MNKNIAIALLIPLVTTNPGWAASNKVDKSGWANVAGYYPGMSKEAAKKVGLANCKEFLGTVECTTPEPIRIGGVASTLTRIELDERSGRLEKIEVEFPNAAFKSIAASMISQYGDPISKNEDYEASDWRSRGYHSSCGSVFLWHKKADEALVICGESGRRGSATHVVADRVKGRGKEWREVAAERNTARQSASSFNSK